MQRSNASFACCPLSPVLGSLLNFCVASFRWASAARARSGAGRRRGSPRGLRREQRASPVCVLPVAARRGYVFRTFFGHGLSLVLCPCCFAAFAGRGRRFAAERAGATRRTAHLGRFVFSVRRRAPGLCSKNKNFLRRSAPGKGTVNPEEQSNHPGQRVFLEKRPFFFAPARCARGGFFCSKGTKKPENEKAGYT